MSNEDQKDFFPIVMYYIGSRALTDGRQELIYDCPNLAEYLQMPKGLKIGKMLFHKVGRDVEKKLAYYQCGFESEQSGTF